MKTVIVFGNDHANSVGVIQSLGIAGYQPMALLFGHKTGLVEASKYTAGIVTAKDAQSCIDKLLQIAPPCTEKQSKIPIIACCDIAALTLESNAEKLSLHFLFEHSSNYSLHYLAKKENQVRLAAEVGINVPKSWILRDSKLIPDDVCYPCLIKPLISCEGAKSDIRVCRSREELEHNLKSLVYTTEVILQEYIERDYEISILGCAHSSGCVIPSVENKLSLYPQNVGLECLANIQPIDESLKDKIEKLISLIGYIGLFSVEMMHSKTDGNLYFTEINLRNDGANAMITKYGANLPLNHVEDLLGLSLTTFSEYHPGYYIWDMHHFQSFIHRDIKLSTWIKDIRNSKGFMMYFREDCKPFYKQYSNLALSKLHLIKDEPYK